MNNEEYTKTFYDNDSFREVEEQKEEVSPIVGIVTDCIRLRVRKAPNSNSEVVKVVPVLTELLIDLTESTEEWFKVALDSGEEGYCMREFISSEESPIELPYE